MWAGQLDKMYMGCTNKNKDMQDDFRQACGEAN